MSDGHDKASFYQGIRAAISWLHAEARGMNDPHAKLVLNNAAFHLGQRKPDPALLPPAPDGATEGKLRDVLRECSDWINREVPIGTVAATTTMRRIAAALQEAPSVSPVRPKGEEMGSSSASKEAAPSGATASWRDLESAPKDGTHILIYGPSRYTAPDQAMKDQVGVPTHWMPLPNPPGADVAPSQPTQTGEEPTEAMLLAGCIAGQDGVGCTPWAILDEDHRPLIRDYVERVYRAMTATFSARKP